MRTTLKSNIEVNDLMDRFNYINEQLSKYILNRKITPGYASYTFDRHQLLFNFINLNYSNFLLAFII